MPTATRLRPAPRPRPVLTVRKVRGMGRGVFAGRAIRAGQVIEVCPVIVLPARAAAWDGLQNYLFKWGRAADQLAVALGHGSLYNHSSDPNAEYLPRFATGEVVFRAVRPIAAGEQIVIDYQWDEADYADFR